MLEQSVDGIIEAMFAHIEQKYLSSAADTKPLDLGKLINVSMARDIWESS